MEANTATQARAPFEALVGAALVGLSPAEQRMAQFFADRKEVVLLASAAEIAERAGASDATVVRTATPWALRACRPCAKRCYRS